MSKLIKTGCSRVCRGAGAFELESWLTVCKGLAHRLSGKVKLCGKGTQASVSAGLMTLLLSPKNP
eukprot:1946141-Amphidinium_carterae.1